MRRCLLPVVAACAAPVPAPDAPPAPVYSRCPQTTRATPESLAAKAAAYDARLVTLHVTPAMPWVQDVSVAPGSDPRAATAADVVAWRASENDGLWTGLALAAEAYRFGATHDPAARDAVATLLAGERTRTRITGVPGLYARTVIPPSVAGLACPADPALYVPSPDKTSNMWVRIGDDGCAQVAGATGAFVSTAHCGLAAFAGWCFKDNVSQDEYVGHLFGLGAVARVVDDPALRDEALAQLADIAAQLAAHDMEFVDWDGRPTQWGKLHPGAAGDSPGYLAVLGLSALATTRSAGYAALAASYQGTFDQIDVWSGCTSNWNDLSMLAASLFDLLADAPDADRALYAATFESSLFAHVAGAHDAWYDVLWAAQAPSPAYDAVDDAVCQLREFPASNEHAAHDTTGAPEACTGRLGESLAASAFGVADRCAATFVWWGDPFIRTTCTPDATLIDQPTGYLLAYWMARYYGFVAADE